MNGNVKRHGNNHHEVQLDHGALHVFASDELFSAFDAKVYEMADNNLRIPRNVYMGYTPDVHVGVGTCIGTTAVWRARDGFVSPSIVGVDIGCGMRVHLTPLHKRDIQDPAVRRQLIEAIERYVPTNERTNSHYADIDIMEVVKHGLRGLPDKYVLDARWLTHVEEATFKFDHAFLSELPAKIRKNAHGQLGTLGSGNHFIELQTLELAEEARSTAEQWGLFDGQAVVMIHSGSRAWGAMLGREFTKSLKETMHLWGIENPDPNLIYAPAVSQEGKTYFNLMYSALNFAVANRHMIAFGVRQALKDVFGEDFELPVLYDLMHNYALKEFHRNEAMIVHRKGATRALPPGHFMNAPAYKSTGHPALIPGSMGTSSYIMVGREAGAKNFYSICHGAGRARSRRATKELVTVDQFAQSLKVGTEDEILVNHRSLAAILDECPQAYKDVDQIIDSVTGAGLAEVVAKCKPMAAIKGI
ncbi:tRNA-splicing ligase RtcB [Paenibacillus phyllosphaerae]|uniref:tRNA-splicing ligase RtcB n=1 Tax=Paenibacillus phyllosphaerae TaxID=274593 RepID=A0A7W5B0A2_9BACL|nr:RtcB family protein [Paenibacillus phyllosphaerae]MBB3112040.1 tRNA-splicing ligase RtcB [Paenibacillus phyllosphaerae]